jgi:hypothetical protein
MEEMWVANMNWAPGARPAPGARFLVTKEKKHVVVVMGYETGPADAKILAGLQMEAAWVLGARNGDIVKIGRLINQTVEPGPIQCPEP